MKHVTDIACPYCTNLEESRIPVTQEALDEFQCPVPGCDCKIVETTPSCHPNAAQHAYYCKLHGTLALFCGVCGELSVTFALAQRPPVQRRMRHANVPAV